MSIKSTWVGGALGALLLSPGIASASFVLDTGTPTGSSTYLLNTSQFLAGEFAVRAGEDVTSLAAYLTQGAGQPGDTFTCDIYGASGFTNRPSQRPAPVFTATGTLTKGLDAPGGSFNPAGTAPALGYAVAGTSGAYVANGTLDIGLRVTATPVPLPAAGWLLAAARSA